MKRLSIQQMVIYSALACFCLIVITYLFDYFSIDNCLDKGGSFNYKEMECDLENTHTKISYFEARKYWFLSYIVSTTTFLVFSVAERIFTKNANQP